jgi:hypothetical protein
MIRREFVALLAACQRDGIAPRGRGRGPRLSLDPYFTRKKCDANQCASWTGGLLRSPRVLRKVRSQPSKKISCEQ